MGYKGFSVSSLREVCLRMLLFVSGQIKSILVEANGLTQVRELYA